MFIIGVVGGVHLQSSAAQADGDAASDTLLNSRRAGPIAIGKPLSAVTEFEISAEREIDATTTGFALSRDRQVVAVVGTSGGPDAPINLIIVLSSEFRTAEGVSPGSAVASAESVYGTAILSYDPAGIGLEELIVSSGPPGLRFFTSDSPEPQAGVYIDGRFATTSYRAQSTIDSIWIDCRTGPCPQPRPAPAAADTAEAAPTAPAPDTPDTPDTTDTTEATEQAAPVAEEPLAATGISSLLAAVALVVVGAGLWTIGVRNVLRLAARDKLLNRPI